MPAWIVTHLSSLLCQSVAAEAERAFAICDQDSDGKITQDEMAFFLRALGIFGTVIS